MDFIFGILVGVLGAKIIEYHKRGSSSKSSEASLDDATEHNGASKNEI